MATGQPAGDEAAPVGARRRDGALRQEDYEVVAQEQLSQEELPEAAGRQQKEPKEQPILGSPRPFFSSPPTRASKGRVQKAAASQSAAAGSWGREKVDSGSGTSELPRLVDLDPPRCHSCDVYSTYRRSSPFCDNRYT